MFLFPAPLIGMGAASFDSATTAWAAAVVSAGGTVSGGRKTLVDNLIVGLKADGVWSKMDRIWLYAAENSQSALIDLVNLGVTSLNNSPTFTADSGYTGNGSDAYLITDFNAATASSPKHVQDDSHWGHWNNTSSVGTQGYSGNYNGGGGAGFQAFAGALYLRLHDSAGAIASTDPTGFWVASRQASTGFSAYQNGSLSEAVTATSNAVGNALFYVLQTPPAQVVSTTECAAYTIGGGLTSTEVGNLYTRLQTYMTAI